MQPGYDALGFISCTGTNFVVRAAALKEVGGSPTYTLTEDFALGMALKMYGWHCRYVQVGLHDLCELPYVLRTCPARTLRFMAICVAGIPRHR
jgi:endoglucanase